MYKQATEKQTLQDIADELGIDKTTVNKYKNHKKAMKTVDEEEEENDTKDFNKEVIPDEEETENEDKNEDEEYDIELT